MDVRGVAAALGWGPLVAVRGGYVVFMQVSRGLCTGIVWCSCRCLVVLVHVPRGLHALVVAIMFRCGYILGVVLLLVVLVLFLFLFLTCCSLLLLWLLVLFVVVGLVVDVVET